MPVITWPMMRDGSVISVATCRVMATKTYVPMQIRALVRIPTGLPRNCRSSPTMSPGQKAAQQRLPRQRPDINHTHKRSRLSLGHLGAMPLRCTPDISESHGRT